MALTAQQIFGFSESMLKQGFDNPQPTPEIHLEMWEKCCGPSRHVAIAAPRGHAKSTCITHTYVLANVLFKESRYVMIVSDTEEQAVLFLADIVIELQENEDLRTVFGIKRFTKETESDVIVQFEDNSYFRIIAKGSEQKIRGRKWRGKRPDLIVGDDLENDDIVMNEERRAKFRRWVNNALIPAMSDDGKIRIVGTILHLDSFLERCMPDYTDSKNTKTDGLRWWTTLTGKTWDSIKYQGHNEDFSMMVWPEKWTEERYRAEKRRYVEDGNPEGYSQEYLNYPIDESSAYFQKSDFLEWKDYDEYLEYYIGVDLAISTKEGRAYTVMLVAGLNRSNDLVVVDVSRFRGDGLKIMDELFRLEVRWKPEVVFMEEENIAKSLGAPLNQAMIDRNIFINIKTMVPSMDKRKRARALQTRMRAGSVRFDKRAEWYDTLYGEMVTFDRGKYADQVDAFSWIGLGLASIAPAYTESDIAQFEEDDELEDFLDGNDGRSMITGY